MEGLSRGIGPCYLSYAMRHHTLVEFDLQYAQLCSKVQKGDRICYLDLKNDLHKYKLTNSEWKIASKLEDTLKVCEMFVVSVRSLTRTVTQCHLLCPLPCPMLTTSLCLTPRSSKMGPNSSHTAPRT